MPEITVTTTITFDPRKVWYEDAMLSGSSYWASEIGASDVRITLFDHVEEVARAASWQQVGEAIALIASGSYRRHDDTFGTADEYAVRACQDLITRPADADWDSNVDDLILQQAAIGKVIYG